MASIAAFPVIPRFPRLPFTRLRGGQQPRRWRRPVQRHLCADLERRHAAAAERARILQDLHDGCGGQLAVALHLVHDQADPQRIADVLRDCIDDLRITLDGCDSGCADLGPLLAAQRDRMEGRLAGSSLQLVWDLDLSRELVPCADDHGLHVLRIVQEAFTNVVKHARASEVRVAGAVEGRQQPLLRLSIRDNGVGLGSGRGGRGLVNMRRRAAQIGATLVCQAADPHSGTGTEIELRLPLRMA